jgi:hypothetical protein
MTAPPSRRPRRWIGFFVVLAVLSAGAIVTNLVYNLSIQLRPEQLAEAQRRWRENAPADYDLEYLVEVTREAETEPDKSEYVVKVRGGRVVLVVDSSEVVYLEPSLALVAGPASLGVSSAQPGRYGVAALLEQIETALRQEETSGRRNFATAKFDAKDGHPFHYVHRVRGTKDRVEWNVKLTRFVAEPRPRGSGRD